MRGQSDPLFVFVNLLTHADEHGVVDRHWKAIMEETGLPEERVKAALTYLQSPDPDSRTIKEEGRRIVLLDDHRTWGWSIVNHAKYRELCSKKQNAERQAEFRKRNALVTHSNKQAVGVGVGVSDKEEGAGGNPKVLALKRLLGDLFQRREGHHWSYLEESVLVDVAQHATKADVALILAWFKSFPPDDRKYRPQSVLSLLQGWGSCLDKARVTKQKSTYVDPSGPPQ